MDRHAVAAFVTLTSAIFVTSALLSYHLQRASTKQEGRQRKFNTTESAGEVLITKDKGHDDSTLVGDRAGAQPIILQGIESCIGNTPLFKIKSLSDATGCEILGKAEVRFGAS